MFPPELYVFLRILGRPVVVELMTQTELVDDDALTAGVPYTAFVIVSNTLRSIYTVTADPVGFGPNDIT